MIAPPASLIDQIYRPMEGRGILETPEMLSGLDGLGGQFASIPGGPGAEQRPTGIEAGIAGMIPAMQQQNLQGGPKALKGPLDYLKNDSLPDVDQYGQPRMHTPGMQQVQVPNPNYGIDPATNKTPNQYLPGIGYINVTGNAETTLPGQLETVVNGGAKLPMRPDGSIIQPISDTNLGFEPAPTNTMQPILTPGVDYDAQANDAGGMNTFADNTDFFNNMHSPFVPTQQPTGGFDSKAFANELLTGIGDLFKQHFPESAQMAFNNSNQQQSQIEQPIQDATTFDVQPQQNMAFNPFSVNTLGGSFGGGY